MLQIPSVYSISARLYSYWGIYFGFVFLNGILIGGLIGVGARFIASKYLESPFPQIIFGACIVAMLVVFERHFGRNILKLKRLAELTNDKELKLSEKGLEISVGLVMTYKKHDSFRAKDVWHAHSLNEFGYVVINWDEITKVVAFDSYRSKSEPEFTIICKGFTITLFKRALGDLSEPLKETIISRAKIPALK